jgi:hypothetical protein
MAAYTFRALLDDIINDLIDLEGVNETIRYLLRKGVTPARMVTYLHFDPKDVSRIALEESMNKEVE